MHTPSESCDRGCLRYTTHSDVFRNQSLFGSIFPSLPTPSLLSCKTVPCSFLDKHTRRLTLMTERRFSPEDYPRMEDKLAEENSLSSSKPACQWGLYNACGHSDTSWLTQKEARPQSHSWWEALDGFQSSLLAHFPVSFLRGSLLPQGRKNKVSPFFILKAFPAYGGGGSERTLPLLPSVLQT